MEGVYHEALVIWEVPSFQSVKARMMASAQPRVFLSSREAPKVGNGTSGALLPTAVMGITACEILGASTFNIGTLPIDEAKAPNEDGPVVEADEAHKGDENQAGPDGMADANSTAAAERG